MVRKKIGLYSRLDLERMRFEPSYEKAEIRCGEWRGRVRKVAGGEEVSDVDCIEKSVHLKRSDGC